MQRFAAAAPEALPIAVKVENIWIERRPLGVVAKGIIDPNEELRKFRAKSFGTARYARGIESMRVLIEALRGEDPRLESDHLRLPEHIGRCICVGLRVDEGCIDRLAFEGRLAAVPHDRGEKVDIGRGKRPPVQRHDSGRWARQSGRWVGRAIIGIVHLGHRELQDRRVRKRQADPDQSLARQKLIGVALGGGRRHIVGGTGRAVDQPENWIAVATRLEPRLYTGRADGPSVLRLMTGETSASIRAKILKKRVSCGGRGTARLEGGDLPTRIALLIKPRNGRRCRLRTGVGIFILSHFLSLADRAGRPGPRLRGVIALERLCQRHLRGAA